MSFIVDESGKIKGAKPQVVDTPDMVWVGYPKKKGKGAARGAPPAQAEQAPPEEMGGGGGGMFGDDFGGFGDMGGDFGGFASGDGGGGPPRKQQRGFGGVLDMLEF